MSEHEKYHQNAFYANPQQHQTYNQPPQGYQQQPGYPQQAYGGQQQHAQYATYAQHGQPGHHHAAPHPAYHQGGPVQQQPQGQQMMRPVAGGAKVNTQNKEVGADGKREWSHGLCDCFSDCSTCCMSCWCPCVMYNEIKERNAALREGRAEPDQPFCSGNCMLFCCLQYFTGCAGLLEMGNRGTTRERYGIRGGGCGDCMASWCCLVCVQTQESREIRYEEQLLLSGGRMPEKH